MTRRHEPGAYTLKDLDQDSQATGQYSASDLDAPATASGQYTAADIDTPPSAPAAKIPVPPLGPQAPTTAPRPAVLPAPQPAPPQATIKAGPRTLLDQIKTADTTLPLQFRALFSKAPPGSLAQEMSGNVYQSGDESNEPQLSFESAMTPLEQQAHPRATGLAEVASGLTTPESAGLLAASGGLGALETPAAGLLRYLPRLVSAGFTAQMVKGLYDAYPAYKNAVDRGDTSEAKRIQTEMGAQGVLAFLSGTHAVTGETPVQAARQGIGELAERTGAPANSLLREISQPSPAPGTAANVPVFAGGRLSEDLAREQVANAAGASGMGQLAQAEQAIPPQEIVAPAPSQPPITPLPAVPPEPNALAIQAALPSHEDLSDAIVKDGGDPNFADNRANQLLAAARGELGYTGIERRAASGFIDSYMGPERRGVAAPEVVGPDEVSATTSSAPTPIERSTTETLPDGTTVRTGAPGAARDIFDMENALVDRGLITQDQIPELRRAVMGAREVTGAPGLMEDTYRDLLQRRLSVEQPETAPALAAGRPSAPVALTGEMHQAANRLFGQLKRDPVAQQFARDSWAAMVRGEPPPVPEDESTKAVAGYVGRKLGDIVSGESLPSTRSPDPVKSGKYAPDELAAARQRMVEASSFLDQQERPGRFEGVEGEPYTTSERGSGTFYAITSLRKMFPWFADMDESPAELKKALARGKGPVYNRLLTSAADYEQLSRQATANAVRSQIPDIDDLIEKVRGIDPEHAALLEQARDGKLSRYDDSLDQTREWVQSNADEARNSVRFSDIVDALTDAADAEPGSQGPTQPQAGASPGSLREGAGILPGLEQAVSDERTAAGREQARKLIDEINRPPESIEAAAGEMERGSPLFRGTEASPQNEMFPPRLAELERAGDEAEPPEEEEEPEKGETENVAPSEVRAAPLTLKEEMEAAEPSEDEERTEEGAPRKTLAQEALSEPARDFRRPGAPPRTPASPAELKPEHMREVMPTAMDRINEMLAEGTHEEKLTPEKRTKATLRENTGKEARKTAIVAKALEPLRRAADKWTPEQVTDFIDRVMHGRKQLTETGRQVAKLAEDVFEPRRREAEQLPHGAYSKWRENYFPGMWQRPGQAEDWMRKVLAGKRPFEGAASFKKAKVFDDFSEGLKAGFKPVPGTQSR